MPGKQKCDDNLLQTVAFAYEVSESADERKTASVTEKPLHDTGNGFLNITINLLLGLFNGFYYIRSLCENYRKFAKLIYLRQLTPKPFFQIDFQVVKHSPATICHWERMQFWKRTLEENQSRPGKRSFLDEACDSSRRAFPHIFPGKKGAKRNTNQ